MISGYRIPAALLYLLCCKSALILTLFQENEEELSVSAQSGLTQITLFLTALDLNCDYSSCKSECVYTVQ